MPTTTDYLVIGAGPAGLQLAYFLDRAGRDYLVVEAGSVAGSFFGTFPRHRQLISSNKRYTGIDDPEFNLRMDWNSLLSDDEDLLFTKYTPRYFPAADDMVRYLGDYATKLGLNIRYDSRVVEVRKGEEFEVADQNGEVYRAPALIVATGPAKPYLPDIPGIELAEPYTTVSVDPQDFVNQRVLILGKGNSAFETADNLIETAAVIHVAGPNSLRLAWQTHFVGHLRAVNNNFLDTYQLKSQNAILDGHVLRIREDGDGFVASVSFSRADGVVKDIPYDRVIACTGFRLDTSIFSDGCTPELVIKDRFPAQTSEWESTNVPGMYFAGTMMQVRDFKKSTSGFIHGFRYTVKALHRILERKIEDREWPYVPLAADAKALSDAIIARVNRSSALWQQFSKLGDLITVAGKDAAYYEEVPVDYAHDNQFADEYFTITLEYGPDHDKVDPFDINARRISPDNADKAYDAAYLHPVIRHFRRGALLAEHHIAENLENDWTSEDNHRKPLTDFLADRLSQTVLTVAP
ncbi:pyridine nucleotide-disulfide oxidoreductase [Actinosynnema sp. ALI-1.44]|uniref:NAD(P)-binding domain-containing protein n=1 Tax=Actinosynnema sp. ALI-1.44 TaxID=1933779 RepID=UPI00097C9C6B|nr:NAD(P)-binding domain-containing protein [Actinosynnema sp. ALI-1.44]ONI74954.1 pyridine nucleotide-disulfide oxidoreductase [Actinosynnema sp. ALI-1.44]